MDPFHTCVKNGRLVPEAAKRTELLREKKTAEQEQLRASSRFDEGRFADAVVQGYFASYRALRVALRLAGYRDTNLFSLLVGLDHLYVQTGKMDPELLDRLREGKEWKDLAQSSGRAERRQARLLVDAAVRAVRIVRDAFALGGIGEVEPDPKADDPS